MRVSDPIVSIIICTANREADLRQTLAALSLLPVPDDLPTELVVADNGSTDGTAALVQEYERAGGMANMAVRHVLVPRRGKGYAYNAGMDAARGRVFLFTDDDVRPSTNWIAGMCRPILQERADGVTGRVSFPAHLERSWMEPMHRTLMASTDETDAEDPAALIGASMAFGRYVREKVPAFDLELGPGALGFADETLFSYQLKEAGYRLATAYETEVEHHFDPSRLTREAFLRRAAGQGRCDGYVSYHWRHETLSNARKYILRQSLRLRYWRFRRRAAYRPEQGPPQWEMIILYYIALHQQYLIEQRRPRNYDKHGLVKRSGVR